MHIPYYVSLYPNKMSFEMNTLLLEKCSGELSELAVFFENPTIKEYSRESLLIKHIICVLCHQDIKSILQ